MKLHLGSGKRYLEGYTHVDLSNYPHIDFRQSIDNLYNFEDESVDEIYASHVFEYFDRDKALEVLHDWRRVLKTGGLLRLAVPNFDALIEVYKSTNDIKKILGPLYGKWEVEKDKYIFHKLVYNESLLKEILEAAGFNNIRYWDWKKVFEKDNNYDDHSQAYFPHMDKKKGIHISLNLEANK